MGGRSTGTKKALTIYVDDDAELKNLCGAFICWRGENNSLTLLNEKVPDDAVGFYLPFEKQEEPTSTKWIYQTQIFEWAVMEDDGK